MAENTATEARGRLRRFLATAACLALSMPLAAQAEKASVAIWRLRSPGVDPGLAGQIHAGLQQSVAGLGNYKLADEAQLEGKLQRAGVLPGSPWETVWPALKVDWVLLGTLTGMGGELALDLRLMNGKDGTEVRRATVALAAEAGERKAALQEVAVRLLAPEKWKGSLQLEVSVEGAQVYLDDRHLATTPIPAPIADLLPGKHILRITREGYGEFSHFVHIRYNQVVHLKVNLENALIEGVLYEQEGAKKATATQVEKQAPGPAVAPDGRLGRILTWCALGAGAAAGGTGAALVATERATATGTVLVVAGGVLVTGALVLLNVSASESPAPAPVAPAAGLANAAWWVGLAGRF